MSDPLSVAASVAGLYTLVAATYFAVDELLGKFKERPKLLDSIAQELALLEGVLCHLSSNAKILDDCDAWLAEPFSKCREVLNSIDGELKSVRSRLQTRSPFKRVVAEMKFKASMRVMVDRRNELERFKTTLILAIQLRSLKKVNIQTENEDAARTPFSKQLMASSTAISEVRTLVGTPGASSFGSTAPPKRWRVPDDPEIEVHVFGSFQLWLDAVSGVQKPNKNLKQPESYKRPHSASTEGQKVMLDIDALRPSLSPEAQNTTQSMSFSPSDFVFTVIESLRGKGYHEICGFEIDGTLFGPWTSHSDIMNLQVTDLDSSYSLAKGLAINEHETIEEYLESLRSCEKDGSPPRNIDIKRKFDCLLVRDYESKTMEIKFERTLRLPEDGSIHSPPSHLGSLPLVGTESFKEPHISGLAQGTPSDVYIPLSQRDALSITFVMQNSSLHCYSPKAAFAVKVFCGSINAITGSVGSDTQCRDVAQQSQDYIIPPLQGRLDGYVTSAGKVKQFVAMKLGSGYTAEKQKTGEEHRGGIQLLIAPPFSGSDGIRCNMPKIQTPQKAGLHVGDVLTIFGRTIYEMSSQYDWLNLEVRPDVTPDTPSETRALFLHEVFRSTTTAHILDGQVRFSLSAVYPLTLQIHYKRLLMSPTTETRTTAQFSPFTHIANFYVQQKASLCTSNKNRADLRLWADGMDITDLAMRPKLARYLYDFFDNNSVVVFEEHQLPERRDWCMMRRGSRQDDSDRIHHRYSRERAEVHAPWECFDLGSRLGLGASGGLKQGIVKDTGGGRWNWRRAQLVSVQILDARRFTALTGLEVPKRAVSLRSYTRENLRFMHELDAVVDDAEVEGFKTVGDIDSERGMARTTRRRDDTGLVGCVLCEEKLVDSELLPCHHFFCDECVKEYAGTFTRKCPACRTAVVAVEKFSVSMDASRGKDYGTHNEPAVSEAEDVPLNAELVRVLQNMGMDPNRPDTRKFVNAIEENLKSRGQQPETSAKSSIN